MVNMTCPTIPDKPSDPKPFFQNGQIDFKAHDVGWLVCGIMALIATISSAWLIWKHLTYYTCPQQQRHIVRLLIMVPIYAIVSFLSYLFYHEALYYQTIRDCYEAVLVTSFFYLILSYTGDTRAEQHAVFRNIEVNSRFWVWPLGSWKYRPEGLHFLWLMKICVLQYAIIRPLCTFIAVGTQYFGYYCLQSWMPWFTHVWCSLFISISVTVAMYCLIQLYMPVRKLVDPYKPILKFLSIKTIVFLTFWQDTFLSFLVSFNVIKATEYFTAEQIQTGINALLQCFWMLLFGFIHVKAFSYLPYRPEDRSRTTRRGKALLDSLDFRDWFVEMKESTRYIAARSKGRNYTLAEDLRAKRHEHLLNALGKERNADLEAEIDMEKAVMPTFWKNPEDAQFWTPSDKESGLAFSSKHTSSEIKPSFRTGQSASDTYNRSVAPNASDTTAPQRYERASRAAELERLVAELDLQGVDQSIVGLDDHDYGFQDERYERSALLHSHDQQDLGRAARKNGHDLPNKCKELDVHPELTQYHTETIQLANVPSLSYEHESASDRLTRTKDLSVVAEEDDDVDKQQHTRQGSRVAAGVGAFGIASWFGWSSSHAQESRQQPAPAGGGLRPEDVTTALLNGAVSELDGTSWWRSYWDWVSNPGSREQSLAGVEYEREPLNQAPPERPAVLREVTAGSWGIDAMKQQQQSQDQSGGGQRLLPQPPGLKIETHAKTTVRDRGEVSVDSTSSPSSRISPHSESPLSRLIQSSRDSFSSLNRDEIRDQVLASAPLPQPNPPTAPIPTKLQPVTGRGPTVQPTLQPSRPKLAPRNPSVAPSSNQASVSRFTSTTTRSDPAPKTAITPTSVCAAPSSDYESAIQEMTSSTDTSSTKAKHPIVFADALLPTVSPAETSGCKTDSALEPKALPPAKGPKGKLVKLVLPSPLSPARFPYGQEGPPQPTPAAEPASTSSTSRREPSSNENDGTVKWAQEGPKPLKPREEAAAAPVATMLPDGKGMITVGGMSLAQAKAHAQAEAERQQRESLLEPQTPPTTVTTTAPAPQSTRSILEKHRAAPREGKLVLPAPSKLAAVEAEDPYGAGQSANVSARTPNHPKVRSSGGGGQVGMGGGSVTTSATRTSIANTAFEVGSIVPRDAPLRGYYDSIRQFHSGRPSSGRESASQSQSGSYVRAQGQRHSFVPSLSGVRPAMLPPHPSQQYQQVYSAHQTQREYQHGQFGSRLPQQQYDYQPRPQPRIAATQQRYSEPHMPRYSQPPPPPPQYPQGRGNRESQFHFEYYRD